MSSSDKRIQAEPEAIPAPCAEAPKRQGRFLGVIVAMLLVGVASVLLTYNAPIFGLTKETRADQALDVVRASAALYLGIGSAGLGLVSAIAAYVWGTGPKRDYWFGLIGVTAAFSGFAAAGILFPLLWDLFSRMGQ